MLSDFEIDWSNPNYVEIYRRRARAIERLRKSPGLVSPLMRGYRKDWVAFINDWMMTYDPRPDDPEKKYSPFILFPRQEELVRWLQKRWRGRERGLVEKSREVGLTWVCAAAAVCLWLFEPHSVVGFGSRKKELVDNGENDSDSIFWKIRTIIDMLPRELLPADYKKGRKLMMLPNPDNGALIKGEIGDEIGRGGRASMYFVDEFAHLEHPNMAESSLSATTDVRIYVSTVNGVNLFYELRMFLPDEQVFIFDWKDDPRKRLNPNFPADEEPWYIDQRKNLLPTTLASQVDRNYNAAVSNSFFTAEEITDAEMRRLSDIEVIPTIAWRLGIDAAGMGNDEIVFWCRRGRMSLPCETFRGMDGVQLAGVVEQKVRSLLRTGPVELVALERDGPGASCADQLKYGPFTSIVQAVHTGRKLKDGKHFNFRAWLHNQAKEYLSEQEVHIPEDATFRAQALAIQYEYRGGLLLIESKEDFRARFSNGKTRAEKRSGRSPDRLDAFLLTFTPPRNKPIQGEGDAVDPLFAGRANSGWRPLDAVMGY